MEYETARQCAMRHAGPYCFSRDVTAPIVVERCLQANVCSDLVRRCGGTGARNRAGGGADVWLGLPET